PPSTPRPSLSPYTTLFRSNADARAVAVAFANDLADSGTDGLQDERRLRDVDHALVLLAVRPAAVCRSEVRSRRAEEQVRRRGVRDRKSTRLNSSHEWISYA